MSLNFAENPQDDIGLRENARCEVAHSPNSNACRRRFLDATYGGNFSWKLNDWQAARRGAHGSLASLNAESQHRRRDSSESISRETHQRFLDLHRGSTVESQVRRCLQAQCRSRYLLSNQSFFNSSAQSGHCQNIDIRLGVKDDSSAMSAPCPFARRHRGQA
jgi:hypothetical protein